MKKTLILTIAFAMIMTLGIGSAFAANSLKQGALALNFDVLGLDTNNGSQVTSTFSDKSMIFAKYFVGKDLAILGGFGFGAKGGDAEGTDTSIAAGVRKYLKVDDFAPFVGGLFSYSSTQDGNLKQLSLVAQFGAEYFLGKQFSIEGNVGFGYSSVEETTVTVVGFTTTETKAKDTTMGTSRSGVSFNYYF